MLGTIFANRLRGEIISGSLEAIVRIENIWGNAGIGLFGGGAKPEPEEAAPGLPRSWGGDSVSISAEARAMRESANDAPEEGPGMSAADEFKAYMEKKRSRAQGVEDIEELIKELEEKAAEISQKIAEIARNKTLPEAVREAQIRSLNNQLQVLRTQVGELKQERLRMQMDKDDQAQAADSAPGGGRSVAGRKADETGYSPGKAASAGDASAGGAAGKIAPPEEWENFVGRLEVPPFTRGGQRV